MKFLIIFISIFLYSANISTTKKELKNTSYKIVKMNKKLDALAKQILNKQSHIKKLNQQQNIIKQQITILQNELNNSKSTLNELQDLANGLNKTKENINNEVVKFISQNYYLDTKNIDSLNDLIYSEISKKALNLYSNEIANLVNKYKNVDNNLKITNNKIQLILNKQKLLLKKQKELLALKQKEQKELKILKIQKINYKKRLFTMIKKEQNLRKKLQELKIVKKREKLINIKKVGSVYFKPKTAIYRGQKTIPPVYGIVVKKFGSYIDPIYKIRIYNDSITIKTKPNALIRSIMNGRVVYIGENGDRKVIFIRHKGNLFSIYANLTKVSPLLKKGSYVKRGQIIARVKDSLEFEVTYKDRPINPLKVIRLR